MNDYWLVRPTTSSPQSACFMKFENWGDDWELEEGISLLEADDVPRPLVLRMNTNPGFPHGDRVQAVLNCSYLTVDEAAREHLAGLDPTIEWLGVDVLDKRGEPLAATYHVANVQAVVDCLDREATRYVPNSIDEERYNDVENLTLRWDVVGDARALLRVRHLEHLLLARADVVDYFQARGVTDMKVAPVDGFSESARDAFRFLSERSG